MKYVTLLRGINVGGNKRVEMKRLASCFESIGFVNVSTYINSGNVIFESDHDDFAHIGKKLEEEFGFEIPTIFRERENIRHLVENLPKEWQNDEKQKTDILFLWDEFDTRESLGLIKAVKGVDHLLYLPGAIVWNISRENYTKSGMNDFIKSKLYKHMTARNINTLRKLGELLYL